MLCVDKSHKHSGIEEKKGKEKTKKKEEDESTVLDGIVVLIENFSVTEETSDFSQIQREAYKMLPWRA